MAAIQASFSRTYEAFFNSEKTGGVLLLACTLLSLSLANSAVGPAYASFWNSYLAGLSISHWINDGLMAVFFLFVGLELERELYNGELAELRKALLPVFAALGGVMLPALVHYAFNAGLPSQAGAGIPMATDIAFALGVLALLGPRVPLSLRIFLSALAVIDDLVAILVIAIFYTTTVHLAWLLGALAVFAGLLVLNRLRVLGLWPYLIGGALMWWLTLRSGVHATLAGVALAFAIPFSDRAEDESSPSHRLENLLHKPVAFVILPVFALANTGVSIGADWQSGLVGASGMGVILGLVLGKPAGIVLMSFLAVSLGLCQLPPGLRWGHIVGAGMLGGIGFTMSIFIANLAFGEDLAAMREAKIAILAASLGAGLLGYLWLRLVSAKRSSA